MALELPLLLDPQQILAHAGGVRIAPTALVTSPMGKVLYRGRLDNRYDASGKRRDAATVHDLQNALEAVLPAKSLLSQKPRRSVVPCRSSRHPPPGAVASLAGASLEHAAQAGSHVSPPGIVGQILVFERVTSVIV